MLTVHRQAAEAVICYLALPHIPAHSQQPPCNFRLNGGETESKRSGLAASTVFHLPVLPPLVPQATFVSSRAYLYRNPNRWDTMAGYQRKTALSPKAVLEMADQVIPQLVGLTRSKGDSHGASFSGEEGTLTVSVHRHGPYTDVVASTDRLRTSRLDYEVQKFLNLLPYEPGDRGDPGEGEPTE